MIQVIDIALPGSEPGTPAILARQPGARTAEDQAVSIPSLPSSPTAAPPPSSGVIGQSYQRRRPEQGTLHRVIRENLKTLYAVVEDGFAGAALPSFVRKELEGYLDCGLLCRG